MTIQGSSPDWFVAVLNINLLDENNEFVLEKPLFEMFMMLELRMETPSRSIMHSSNLSIQFQESRSHLLEMAQMLKHLYVQ